MRRTIRLAVVVLAAVLAPAAVADCGYDIIDDWVPDSVIQGTYSDDCYASALAQINGDYAAYSNIVPDIQAARARDNDARLARGVESDTTADSAGAGDQAAGSETERAAQAIVPPGPVSVLTPAAAQPASVAEAAVVVTPIVTSAADGGPVGTVLQSVGSDGADAIPLAIIVLAIGGVLFVAGGLAAYVIERTRWR